MNDQLCLEYMPLIHAYTAEEAVEDGTLIDLTPQTGIMPISQIGSMEDYLSNYGAILGRKAIHALAPLHVPNRDPLPDLDDLLREPFDCQKHVIAASIKMMDTVGSGFIVGEMGTGKTLLGMSAVHKHAVRPRRQGGLGGRYRAIVLCPDHLIGKWCRELEETIPGAIVTRFGSQGTGEPKKRKKKGEKEETGTRQTLRDIVRLFDKADKRRNRWDKPEGPEWYVLGRNQAKWLSDWAGIADPGRRLDGTPKPNAVSSKSVVVSKVDKVDDTGRPIYDKAGYPVKQSVTGRVYYCPSCGTVVRDGKGVPVSAIKLTSDGKSKQQTCKGTYMQMVPDPDKPQQHGKDRLCPVPGRFGDKKPGQEINHAGKKWVLRECKEPLWNYTSRPYRWWPAQIIQRKLKRMFQYLVIDEVHEQKSDESGQSMACSKLIGAVDHVLALTGTIIGGYANHLYPLLMRISPKSLRDEGFVWGKEKDFVEIYGRIDRVVTTTEDDDSGPSVHGRASCRRKARSGKRHEDKYVRPGVMPQMFGRHMIGSSMFITLEELADELPDLFEYVGGVIGPAPKLDDFSGDKDLAAEEKYAAALDHHNRMEDGWFDTACDMEPAQAAEYKRVMAILEFASKELLRRGSSKLLGTYLWTGLDYPDRPFGWGHDPDVVRDMKRAHKKSGDADDALAKLGLTHTIGYWDKPGVRTVDNFIGVVTPQDCPEDVVYPKEQRLIDICKKQKADGRQTWVYVNMTGKRNIQPRLRSLLEKEGLKVGVLRSDDVKPIEREEWIAQHGREFDVVISHPQLVSTGLDLFSKVQGGHNYSTIVFYETGYNLFTMAQAARRAWRIGQPLDCRVYYLYYKETMQHKAMSIMSRKKSALDALNGDFSADGLAAMAGEDNLQMALAKNLSERIDDSDMQRSWSKVKSGPKKRKVSHAMDRVPPEHQAAIVASTAAQIVAESLAESEAKPVPPEAVPEHEPENDPEVIELSERDFERRRAAIGEAETEREPVAGMKLTGKRYSGVVDLVRDLGDDELAAEVQEVIEMSARDGARLQAAIDEAEAADQTILKMPEFDDTFDEDVDYAPDYEIPELTEEILMKMFANMAAHGIDVA